jgi:sigma-B regulation protein RsbU (phosphoserine phosphatase)
MASYEYLFNLSIALLQAMCVIVVAAYLIIRSGYFAEVMDGRSTPKSQAILILSFGAVSVYGSVMGVSLEGAVINVRDLGPLVGGLASGPLVGIGAGLMGAAFRMTQGGFTALSCSLATILAGLSGGLIFMLRKGRFPGLDAAVSFAALFELFHMALTLAICRPFYSALEVVEAAVVPMVLANGTGMLIFAYIISNLIHERETRSERDRYQRELERKKAELEVAAEIQRSFLPERIPTRPGVELAATTIPAMEVGGDFYDFIPGPDGKLGLVVADVAGKGVPAALFMALSRTIVRANAAHHLEEKAVLHDANAMIAADASSGMFVTLFYGILDGSRTLSYANAGHLPPLLLRSGEVECSALQVTGIAMGAVDDAEYGQQETALSSGDILVIYTDGVTEAINLNKEEYGLSRLCEAVRGSSHLSAQGIMGRILEDISRFSGGEAQSDDITVVVLKAE